MGAYQKALDFIGRLSDSDKSPEEQLKEIEKYLNKKGNKGDAKTKKFLEDQVAMVKAWIDSEVDGQVA